MKYRGTSSSRSSLTTKAPTVTLGTSNTIWHTTRTIYPTLIQSWGKPRNPDQMDTQPFFDFEPLDDAAMPVVINVIAAMTIFNESTKNC